MICEVMDRLYTRAPSNARKNSFQHQETKNPPLGRILARYLADINGPLKEVIVAYIALLYALV